MACRAPDTPLDRPHPCPLLHRSGTPADAPKGDLDDDMPLANRLSMLSARSRSAGSQPSRPGSAVINLRGSRPNSAAIAQEIEGFEDDFMVGRSCWVHTRVSANGQWHWSMPTCKDSQPSTCQPSCRRVGPNTHNFLPQH